MVASLLAVMALSSGIGFCDTIAHLAKPEEEAVAAEARKETKAEESSLEGRLEELGAAIKNLSHEISHNTKKGAKTADERIRREFETIKKGLVEATNSAETKAKETGSEANSQLKGALKRLSQSIDQLAQKISKQ